MVTTPSFTGTCDKEFALTGTTFLQAQRGELITIKGTSVFSHQSGMRGSSGFQDFQIFE